jgi:hypothetical protein
VGVECRVPAGFLRRIPLENIFLVAYSIGLGVSNGLQSNFRWERLDRKIEV